MKMSDIMIVLAGLSLTAGSCVKEDLSDCPPDPTGSIVAAVRDKNYDNAAEVGDTVVDENLPITSYISSLVLWNHGLDSDAYNFYEEHITSEEAVHPIPDSRLDRGENMLTAIGNENVRSQRFGRDANTLELHPSGLEGEDVYFGSEIVTNPAPVDRTIYMLRTKGKLTVDVSGTPDNIEEIVIGISNVRGIVREKFLSATSRADDPDPTQFEYDGSVSVKKVFHTAATGGQSPYEVILAPSASAEGSVLNMTFTNDSGATMSAIEIANIAIVRNHITRLRAEYNDQTRTWTITVMVDGNWKKIENMSVL